MTKHLYIQTMRILLVCALVQLAGCSRRELDSLPEESMYGEVYLNINLNIDNGESYSRANRPDSDESLEPGTANENVINTLCLLWKNADDWTKIDIDVEKYGSKSIKIKLDEDISQFETFDVWLGANLDEEQIQTFMNDNSAYEFKTQDNEDWRNKLAPFDSDNFSERNDIAMFCKKSVKPQVVFSNLGKEYRMDFQLKRLVAKVLVACKEGEKGFASLAENTESNFNGWIKLSDVYYAMNGVNRNTYIMQRVKENSIDYDYNVEDANVSLKEYTQLYNDQDDSGYLEKVKQDFYFYNISELLYKNNIYNQVEVHNAGGEYTKGIYCPENTFFFNYWDEERKLREFHSAWGMITSVSIKAKFTPRNLNVEGDLFDYIINQNPEVSEKEAVEKIKQGLESSGNTIAPGMVYEVDCISDDVADVFLEYSLKKNNFILEEGGEGEGFPNETYFYNELEKKYYTYGAAKIKYNVADGINTTKLGNYQPYYDGWGFYYTYIDNRLNKEDAFAFYKHGQVERNRYYVITINSFSSPGASSDKPKYVEVNTDVVPWKSGGSGSLVLQ